MKQGHEITYSEFSCLQREKKVGKRFAGLGVASGRSRLRVCRAIGSRSSGCRTSQLYPHAVSSLSGTGSRALRESYIEVPIQPPFLAQHPGYSVVMEEPKMYPLLPVKPILHSD